MAFDPLSLLIGAGAMGIKHFAFDKPQADRERKLSAETAKWRFGTGLSPKDVDEPDLLGSMIAGASGGANMGAEIAKANALDAQTEWLKRSRGYNNPWGTVRGTGLIQAGEAAPGMAGPLAGAMSQTQDGTYVMKPRMYGDWSR